MEPSHPGRLAVYGSSYPTPHTEIFERETDELIQKLTETIFNESDEVRNYWQCFCCLCPKIWNSRIYNRNEEIVANVRAVFQKCIGPNTFKYSPSAIFISRADGKLIDCNDAYLSMLGFSKEEVIGELDSFLECVEGEGEILKTQIGNGVVVEQFQKKITRKDGSSFWAQVAVSKIPSLEGTPDLFIYQILDISQVKDEEAQALKTISELQALIRDFKSMNNHELRTALHQISAHSSVLKREKNSLSRDETESLHQSLFEASDRLLGLLNANADFHDLRDGEVRLSQKAFSLKSLLKDVLSDCLERTGDRIEVVFDVDSDVPVNVIGDKRALCKVLEYILSNSIKRAGSGHVLVKVRNQGSLVKGATLPSQEESSLFLDFESRESPRRAVGLGADEECVLHFEVSDTGPSISSKDLPTLFDPYDENSELKRGSDLGLFVAQRLIHLMGGEVLSVESPNGSGGGTSFSFNIKARKIRADSLFEHVRCSLSLGQIKEHLKDKRILVVDDSPLNRKLLVRMLTQSGLRCEEAENGKAAVDILRRKDLKPFDLVLMDLQMPVMDGLEATKAIREELQLVSLPIIALTGNDKGDYKEECFVAGMNSYQSKPVNERILFEEMHQFIFPDGVIVEGITGKALDEKVTTEVRTIYI